jgi:hypothetical protein
MDTTKKTASKKPAVKKAAAPAKKPAKPEVKRTPNAEFIKPMTPSAQLAAVVVPCRCRLPIPLADTTRRITETPPLDAKGG